MREDKRGGRSDGTKEAPVVGRVRELAALGAEHQNPHEVVTGCDQGNQQLRRCLSDPLPFERGNAAQHRPIRAQVHFQGRRGAGEQPGQAAVERKISIPGAQGRESRWRCREEYGLVDVERPVDILQHQIRWKRIASKPSSEPSTARGSGIWLRVDSQLVLDIEKLQ